MYEWTRESMTRISFLKILFKQLHFILSRAFTPVFYE